MEKHEVFTPIHEYPIDSIPIDFKDYIKVYKPALKLVRDIGIEKLLSFGASMYNILLEGCCNLEDANGAHNWIFFLAETGYDPSVFKPNSQIIELVDKHPNIAITDIDKALLGLIYMCYCRIAVFGEESLEINRRQLLCSFISFLLNAQSYEQRTGATVDLSTPLDDIYVFLMLATAYPQETKSKLINLSETQVSELSSVLTYRKSLYEAVKNARMVEIEYAKNKENESYWNSFISCINNRSAEEERVVKIIYSNEGIDVKSQELEKYLQNILIFDSVIPEVGFSLEKLLQKSEERWNYARNYMWAKTSEGELVRIDSSVASILSFPCSFNCVLIAYHAFLLKQNEKMLGYLTLCLSGFIIRNISQISDVSESFERSESIEDILLYISNLIFEFYNLHSKAIDSQSYDAILKEDALSGLDFKGDILRLVGKKGRELAKEYETVIDAMDPDKKLVYATKLYESISSENLREIYNEFESSISSILPYKKIDGEELINQEIGKRLIVSINAIYILAKTIERALPLGLFDNNRIEEIENAKRRLSKLEDYLVKKTYIAPDFSCFESQDLDMAEYRLIRGIDATKIENNNRELYNKYLFESFKKSVKELRNEKRNFDYEKASQIKNTLREKIKEYPECESKEFILELIDQESEYLSAALMESNSGTAEFDNYIQHLCEFLGPSSSRLPASSINALATAELLFCKYATQEYANVDFDYSCISVLYYQAFESLYNELLWSKYASMLNSLKDNGDWFTYLYQSKKLSANTLGYLPAEKVFRCLDEKNRITTALTMGSFNYLLRNATSNSLTKLPKFRAFIDNLFGYDNSSANTADYQVYQGNIDELYKQIKLAIPRRNAASHGLSVISLEECKTDKMIVLSDIENSRTDALGLIKLFLSLFKKK